MYVDRRVIRGRTYDRLKSEKVAVDEYTRGDDGRKCCETLYRTAGGAFFIVRLIAPESGDADDFDDEQWEPLSRAQAEKWFQNGVQITLHDESVFALPEEAKAEDEDEGERTVALTVRVPSTLRDRLARAADKEHLSMNAYIVRCVDRCLEGPRVVG